MRAVRIPLFVLLAVLFFILWNAAWVTDRCGEWTAAVDTVTADLDAGGDGGAALGTLDDLWQDVQGYMHIIVSHEDLDEAEALMAQAKACHDELEACYRPAVDFAAVDDAAARCAAALGIPWEAAARP